MKKQQKPHWMTMTGGLCFTVAGIAGGLAQVLPLEGSGPWLLSLAIVLFGIGGALTGKGIHRRLPTAKQLQRQATRPRPRKAD